MRKHSRFLKRSSALVLSAALLAGSCAVMPSARVEAAQTGGDAPFINTWLVAGPAEHTIYGTEETGGYERPVDGNWAKLATASANSVWSCPWHTHDGSHAIVKGLGNFWAADASDGVENKELTVTWEEDVPVKSIEIYGAPTHIPGDGCKDKLISPDRVRADLYDAEGNLLESVEITDIPDGDSSVTVELEEEITNVRKMVVTPSMDESTDMNMTIQMIAVYDGLKDEPMPGNPPEEAAVLTGVTAEANNVCDQGGCSAADGAVENAIDGSLETAWRSKTHQGVVYESGVLTLKTETSSLLTGLRFTAYEDAAKKTDVVYTLLNSSREELKKGIVTCTGAADDRQEISFGSGVADVRYVVLEFEPISTAPNHLGFREVELIGVPAAEEPEPEKDIDVTPVLGETFNGDTSWQYFDDRIYNRNTDDYNDLYGYFEIKQGLDTTDKFVYAHTYVYSPVEQDVQLRYAVSGVSKVFVNDVYVGGRDLNSMPSVNELFKDNDKVDVTLKSGWNKVLFEIQHVMVPDAKQSPWEMVHFMKTKYMGLYARISDQEGNAVDGVVYSVSGPNTAAENELQVVTQGLDIDREAFEERNADIPANEYPENELPTAYTEWPYVWNKAVYRSDRWAPQAGKFQFQAAGGAPGYKWSLESGELPPGLTLNEDGTIDGYLTEETGEYPFTVKVTDSEGNTATKETKIVVKERPNKWLEEAGSDALAHTSDSYAWYYDENFSHDLWAERVKNQGVSLVVMESMQVHGKSFWPTKSIDPAFDVSKRDPEALEMVDGKLQVKDGLMPFKEAAERHGVKFGLYYGFYYTWQEIVDDLIERYNPSYFFFDGNPQSYENADIAWSMVRSYNDDILIQSNDQKENGDNDLTILEGRYYFDTPYLYGGYWEANMLQQNKYTVLENWNGPYTKEMHGENAQTALDWRLACKAFVVDLGHGYIRNWEQGIGGPRTKDPGQLDKYVKYISDVANLRQEIVDWYTQLGKPDKRESLFGTMPYMFDYEMQDNYTHEYRSDLAIKYGEGPEWGYVLSRDNNFYMHMVEVKMPANELTGQYSLRKEKTGFTGQETVEAGPFDYEVTSVQWFNEGTELPFTSYEKDGKYYATIDTSSVTADPVDTIIKVQTADPERDYKMTSVKAYSDRIDDASLKLTVECPMNDLPTVLAVPESLTFASSDPSVAAVDENGTVTAGAEGKAEITVTAVYEGVTKTDTYPVKVDGNGVISEDLELAEAVLTADGSEMLGEYTPNETGEISLQGRTERGGGIDLDYLGDEAVTYHYAVIDENEETVEVPEEESIFVIKDGLLSFNQTVTERTRLAVWADVQVDGTTYTTNKVFIWALPSDVVSDGIVPEASGGTGAEYTTDGKVFNEDGADTDKWTASAEDETPSLTYDLGTVCRLDGVEIAYNGEFWRYINAPDKVTVEVSDDGSQWRTVVDGAEAPGNNTNYHFEDFKTYSFDDSARYVRVSFPGGAQADSLDIMEVRIRGMAEEPEEPAEPANKTLLQKSYDYALTLSTDGVADSAKEIFEKALAQAKAVLDDPDATQAEVDAAWNNLLEGIWGLGLVKGDTTMLEMLIERAEAMTAEADRYVEDNWQQLTDALAAAKEVAADGDALQGDVEEASDALLNAILAQRYKANKDNLQSLVDSVADIDLSKYTEESVQVFKTALAQANAILADETLSTDDQEKVDAAVEELTAARDGLTAKADGTGDGSGEGTGDGGSTDDGNTGNGSTEDGNTGGNGSGDGSGSGNSGTSGNGSSDGNSTENGSSGNKAAKTGDSTPVGMMLAVLAAAAAAGAVVVKKRKN